MHHLLMRLRENCEQTGLAAAGTGLYAVAANAPSLAVCSALIGAGMLGVGISREVRGWLDRSRRDAGSRPAAHPDSKAHGDE